jgi:hypothetical protein
VAQNVSSTTAVCFLLIGQLGELPKIAIKSALERTSAPIYVGVLDDRDSLNLPQSHRIKYIKLNLIEGDKSSGADVEYQDFSTDSFYQIVQYKWQLLLKLMELDYEYIIYSDTDVYWNLNPLPIIEQVFLDRPSVQVQIQSFTDDPSDPKLCMGFVAFRVSSKNKDFLRECAEKHHFESSVRKRVGDDDIVTQKFAEDGFPSTILELPQTTFPVGRMLKLYRSKSVMPGLGSPEPYIFHANYVVGLTNKLILIKLFIRHYSSFDKGQPIGVLLYSKLILKRLRQSLHDLRVKILSITKSN